MILFQFILIVLINGTVVTKKISDAIQENDVDMILCNYDRASSSVNIQKQYPELPMMLITHSPSGSFSAIAGNDIIKILYDNGASIFFVSEHQYNARNKTYRRMKDAILPYSGFITPSFCSGNEQISSDILYDVGTIGRANKEKNPFWAHKICSKSGLSSLVLTSKIDEYHKNTKNGIYLNNNQHWKSPQDTFYNLPHDEVMKYISLCGLYLSTWNNESFGITALEALSYGVPLCLISDSNDSHASECIPASPKHFCNIKKNITPAEFHELVKKFRMSYEQRLEISQMTKDNHSRDKWISSFERIIDITLNNHKKKKMSQNINDFLI